MVVPLTCLRGILARSSTVRGDPLVRTSYSDWPILIVPEGITTLCCASAFSTSAGAMPLDCIAAWSMLTLIWRCLPP